MSFYNYTGKVIDLIVKGSYCYSCTYWKDKQATEDSLMIRNSMKNILKIRSGGKIEVDSMKEMFGRSEEKFGFKTL